jgi:hypothetical protein
MSTRHGVTLIATILPGRVDPLRQVLCEIAVNAKSNPTFPFDRIHGVHFARWVILPRDAGNVFGDFPEQVMYASEFDGSRRSHLEQLVESVPTGLDRILGHCEGYPAPERRTRDARLQFLAARAKPFGSLYQSTTGKVDDIHNESHLRECIQTFLDSRDWRGVGAVTVYQTVRDFVRSEPSLAWALQPRNDRGLGWHVGHWAFTIATVAILILLIPLTLPLTLIWLAVLRFYETHEPTAVPTGNTSRVRELTGYEDRGAQNQLTILGIVKPTWFRRVTLWGVLKFFYLLVAFGIPFKRHFFGVKTIHFARFQTIDGGSRLLFMSNYDGSWESYLGDFVDRLSFGISGVWSNAVGFPETQFLLFGGARHEQVFKALVRDHQVPPAVWYSAYNDLTVENINNNAAIREGLARNLTGSEVASWLLRF